MDNQIYERETFAELIHRKLPAGIERLHEMLKISPHWLTKVMNGKHTHIDAQELRAWAKVLKEEAPVLIREYGVGRSVITIDEVNSLYTEYGCSFELPSTLPHAA